MMMMTTSKECSTKRKRWNVYMSCTERVMIPNHVYTSAIYLYYIYSFLSLFILYIVMTTMGLFCAVLCLYSLSRLWKWVFFFFADSTMKRMFGNAHKIVYIQALTLPIQVRTGDRAKGGGLEGQKETERKRGREIKIEQKWHKNWWDFGYSFLFDYIQQ